MTSISASEQAAREERLAAIRRCRSCDPCGWRHGPDGTPIDPARRCDHGKPAPLELRDVTAPIHEPDLFSEPRHTPTETRR